MEDTRRNPPKPPKPQKPKKPRGKKGRKTKKVEPEIEVESDSEDEYMEPHNEYMVFNDDEDVPDIRLGLQD